MSQTKKTHTGRVVKLSKSRIADGLICEKKAYLSAHSPDKKAEVSKTQQARFDAGNEVGERARKLFPDGVLISRKPWEIEEAKSETFELIKAGINSIYEATFGNEQFHCRVDVLHRESPQTPWSVFEVKSGVDPKTEYILDLAIQCWICPA